MGKVDPMFFSGRIGPVIHYQMGKGYYTRSMPRKFKQTKATKLKAKEFGQASTIGAAIRSILSPVMPESTDAKMRGQLVGVVFSWLQRHKFNPGDPQNNRGLNEFQFDLKVTPVQKSWRVKIDINNPSPGLVRIRIPAFVPTESISKLAGIRMIACQIAIGSLDLKTGQELGQSEYDLNFDYNNILVEEKIIDVNLPTPKESMVVTGAQMRYGIWKNDKLKYNTKKAFIPAGIIDILVI